MWTYILVALLPLSMSAQNPANDSLSPAKLLETLPVLGTRLATTAAQAPLSVSFLDKKRIQLATQQLSPYEILGGIPGVFALNADNFSQDLRLSVRGFGARSAFGIRGIRIFTDGLPEGTPDGQADVDNLDMGAMRQLEVLRGAAAGLYGNASGGALLFYTENPDTQKPLLEVQTVRGMYGFQRYQLKIGQRFDKWLYFINVAHNQSLGYRAWSGMKNTILNAKMTYFFNPNTKISVLANQGTSPVANDPGGLTQAQMTADRRQANTNNLAYQTGEEVRQSRIGLTFESQWQQHQIQARLFYTDRHLVNRLAVFNNGYGDLRRNYGGGGVAYQWTPQLGKGHYRIKVGLDIENQIDRRQRWAYRRDTTSGKTVYIPDRLVSNQREMFDSRAFFILQEWQPSHRWQITAGLRYDHLVLAAEDLFLSDGDQSGERTFKKWNPSLGIQYKIRPFLSVFANANTSFETPTLNELSNNPNNLGGFNPSLLPQQALSVEVGLKGRWNDRGRWDMAIYHISTDNDLVPYQLPQQGNKVFFRNAGQTQRLGVEASTQIYVNPQLTIFMAHSTAIFQYKQYVASGNDFSGNAMPGLPRHHGQIEARYEHPKGGFCIIQGRYASKIWVNDANTATTPQYMTLNLRLGWQWHLRATELSGFMGINNLLNQHYVGNVLLNATADRFYEPAMSRYIYAGIKYRLDTETL